MSRLTRVENQGRFAAVLAVLFVIVLCAFLHQSADVRFDRNAQMEALR